MKKVWKGAAAAIAALSLGVTGFVGATSAYADDPDPTPGTTQSTTTTTGKIKADEHSYNVYQIFVGDYFEGKLSNVKAGKNYAGTNTEAGIAEALEALQALPSDATNAVKLATIKQYVNLTDPAYTVDANAEIDVTAGYYILEDSTELDQNDAKNLYVAMVAGGDTVTVTKKRDTVSSDKLIKDKTDGAESDWQHAADHQIGDEISYKLVANLPNNVSEFTDGYTLTFTDDMSAGLTYKPGSASIKVNDTEVATTDPTAVEGTSYDKGQLYQWALGDITKAPYSAGNSAVITIEYKATLNKDAVVGNAGNPNKSHIIYSSNPNVAGETNTTPDKTAITFTYKVDVNKIDSENKPLAGADFDLFRIVDDKEVPWATNLKVKGEDGTSFSFKGLDDGTYVLKETATPDGYNSIKPIKFTVTAGHLTTNGSSADYVDPTFTKNDGTGFYEGELTFTPTVNGGTSSVAIVNKTGSNLPSTGGMGTVVLYTVGGAIVLIAGLGLAIALRRRQA